MNLRATVAGIALIVLSAVSCILEVKASGGILFASAAIVLWGLAPIDEEKP